ncbi:hypothetical protein QG37_04338 [Candidozyma auris]|uniref:Uncharacterized protein n=1 Tax=Candidozyma auris TaxID=498019 RepID=A0A0L0NWB7_CANAR|nr:hypothetical protein QG37_04338 [[Candida] auris]
MKVMFNYNPLIEMFSLFVLCEIDESCMLRIHDRKKVPRNKTKNLGNPHERRKEDL